MIRLPTRLVRWISKKPTGTSLSVLNREHQAFKATRTPFWLFRENAKKGTPNGFDQKTKTRSRPKPVPSDVYEIGSSEGFDDSSDETS